MHGQKNIKLCTERELSGFVISPQILARYCLNVVHKLLHRSQLIIYVIV